MVCGVISVFTVPVTVKFSFEVKSLFSGSISLSSSRENITL